MNAATLPAPSATPSRRPPSADAIGKGGAIALGVHVLLVIALSLGVSWHTSDTAPVSAELWAAVPQVAAPAPLPRVEPKAEPKPEPKPEPRAEPKPAPPPPEADIAIKKAPPKPPPKVEPKEEPKPDPKLRAEEERKKAEAKKAEAKKAEDEKAAKAEKAEQERLDKLREDNLRRMTAQLGGTGTSANASTTGTAAQNAAPSASYAGRIIARIKPNIIYEPGAANPKAEVLVKLSPDGTIIGRTLTKPSGDKAWDEAVLRALDKTEMLPRDTDGRVQPSLVLTFTPRDF